MNRCIFGDYRYIFETEKDFGKALTGAVSKYDDGGATPVRLVFFGSPADNAAYANELAAIHRIVEGRWGERSPMVTYVAQPPLDGVTLAMEIHEVGLAAGDSIEYRSAGTTPYIMLSGPWGRKLVTGGIQGGDLGLDTRSQSDEVFAILGAILKREGMEADSIVRQWNYLERITDFDGEVQRYQAFNDSRSRFYGAAGWTNGYPAATGIGAQCGGVAVEVDAVELRGAGVRSIDNSLQVAAHDYSKDVLLGEGRRTTPKFERGKALWDNEEGMVYISGTAAIRGEESLTDSGIAQQTAATLENIDFLVSAANLAGHGVDLKGEGRYGCFRVYLKDAESLEEAKRVISRSHGDVPAVYVVSNVCRCELLIEIEGVLMINY